jgi:flavin reductase (DIM6/NTAB) family NADH-FMN oxidoreductase RutF
VRATGTVLIPWQEPRPLEPRAFRAVLRSFVTGVTVVTSGGAGAPCGVTANAFASLSFDPPLVLVCLNARSSSAAAIARNGAFAVNVLAAGQEWLSRRFASPARPRGQTMFRDVPHRTGTTGAALLDAAVAWLECRLHEIHAGGDHLIVIGEVLRCEADQSREPLVFHAGRYRGVTDTCAEFRLSG